MACKEIVLVASKDVCCGSGSGTTADNDNTVQNIIYENGDFYIVLEDGTKQLIHIGYIDMANRDVEPE